jgi:hypothetical protein
MVEKIPQLILTKGVWGFFCNVIIKHHTLQTCSGTHLSK